MDVLHDSRTNCFSVLVEMRTRDYLELIRDAHAKRGIISGQRDVLKTTTAKRIRDRMVSDIRQGAVLPPVVLGAVVGEDLAIRLGEWPLPDNDAFVEKIARGEVSIIDGMQRTAALFAASEIDQAILVRPMRVEFWVARAVRSLIYRMLVLNMGQVPWTLARQLSVVYAPLLVEIEKNVPAIQRLFTPDKPGRRTGGGEFSSDALVELYLAFSLRKTNVDSKESLSEEFSRLDFVENLANPRFQEYFYAALTALGELDLSFDRYSDATKARFSRGRDIFGSQPARIGFIVAIAQYVIGRPGLDRSGEESELRIDTVRRGIRMLTDRLNGLSEPALGEFLKTDVLSEYLDRRVGQVGRYERSIFYEAFKVLIEEKFSVENMEPCWRAN